MEIQLTKRQYLGEGYFHQFKNNLNGNIVYEECTRDDYLSLGVKDGWKNNPTRSGLTWLGSVGGTVKVNTKSTFLGLNEYTELPNYTAVNRGK